MAVNDSLFAAAAASGGIAEVTISRARRPAHATDPQLKQFSQKMIDDHTRMNAELTQLAAQKQIPLPRDRRRPRPVLSPRASPASRARSSTAVTPRPSSSPTWTPLGTFEAEAERGQDPQVKALAAKAVPHIKEHLKTIRPIALKYKKEKRDGGGRHEHQNETK